MELHHLQIAAAEHAGKQIIVRVGAIKNFGYPDFFVPAHHRLDAFREGSLIDSTTQPRTPAFIAPFSLQNRYGSVCIRLIGRCWLR
jgi:hypothetical protein